MKYQKGYLNLDGFITALIITGIAIGLILGKLFPWLWSLIKPAIHAATGG